MQRIVLLAEVGRHVRRAEQTSGEVIVPGVIRTLDAIAEPAFRVRADARAAMAAHVEERANLAVLAAGDDDALLGEGAGEEIAGAGNLIDSAGADPPREIEAVELRSIEIRVGVEAPRQRGRHDRWAAQASRATGQP